MSVKHEGIYINFSNNISSQDIFPQGNCFKNGPLTLNKQKTTWPALKKHLPLKIKFMQIGCSLTTQFFVR